MNKILTCSICGVTSENAKFYARVNSRCAECHKARVREHRAANVEYYRAYDAKRFQEDPKVRERHKRYRATGAGKAAMQRAHQRYREAYPERRAAHVLLGSAVRDGRVTKPGTCERCGAGGRIEGHHHDYARPLDVTWLCRSCHAKEHRDD